VVNLNRALIYPIIALVALLVKLVFNIELRDEQIDVIIEAILSIAILTGFWMNPKKQK
jgi:uncharacterized membrane protein